MYKMLLASSGVGYGDVVEMDSRRQQRTRSPGNATSAVAISRDGTRIAFGRSATDRNGVSVFDAQTWELIPSALLPNATAPSISDMMFSPDGSRLAVATSSLPGIVLYDTTTWGIVTGAGAPELTSGSARGVAWSPDGSLLAILGTGSPYLFVYDVATMTRLPTVAVPPTAPSSSNGALRFSPDGSKLAVGSSTVSPQLSVYDTTTWVKQAISGTPGSVVLDLAWSPDGKFLATVGGVDSGTGSTPPFSMSVWDTTVTPWVKKTLTGVRVYNTSCAFTPDGKYLAATRGSWMHEEGNLDFYDTVTWTHQPEATKPLVPAIRHYTDIQFYMDPPRYMRGTVRDVGGNPVARKVRAYLRSTGDMIAETTSDAVTGNYELPIYRAETDLVDLQFLTVDGELLNDLFYARATTSAT